jgi:hypothetical protein
MKEPNPMLSRSGKSMLYGLALVAVQAGRLHADIVMDPGTALEDRFGYVIDNGGQNAQIVYFNFSLIPIPTDSAHSGSSNYATAEAIVSNTSAATINGTSFDLASTALASILQPTASFALAHAYNEYLAYFHVTTLESFDPLVSLSATAATGGQGQSYEYLAAVYLYDTTSSQVVYDQTYAITSGSASTYQIPTRVDLIPGAEYFLAGETYVVAAMNNPDGSGVGFVSGGAEARFSLAPVSVPEPSTLAVGAAGALLLASAGVKKARPRRLWTCRRSAHGLT